MDPGEVQAALDHIYDGAILFHGYADYMRDYDVYTWVAPREQREGEKPELRYRFRNCVEANVRSAVRPVVWPNSLSDDLLEPNEDSPHDAFLWGVRWQNLDPGGQVLDDSPSASRWTDRIGMQFMAVNIETNVHVIDLVFTDLHVEVVEDGTTPFEVATAS